MHDFLYLIFSLLRRGMALAILAAVLCGATLTVSFLIHRRITGGQKKFPWRNSILLLLLVGYLALLLYATLLRYASGGYASVNLHLFRAWREAWNSFSLQGWLNILLNVALFVPLGVLLPLMAKGFRKWYWMLAGGFGTSLAIELLQRFTGRGLFDVDDLLANTLGAALGYCAVMIILTAFRGRGKRFRKCMGYGAVPLVFVLVLAGTVAGYQLQEFGNLPSAPAFSANTRGVVWTPDCQLPDTEETAPTYRTEALTKESCDVFGAAFAEKHGITFPDASYYDSSAIYMNHATGDFLYVSYPDGSYEYSVGGVNDALERTELAEETLRALLASYDIVIPDSAEFSYEGNGVHTFTVRMEQVGDTLVDGILTCRCRKNDTLESIENHLITYTFYKDVPILSQAQAYEQLCKGNFSNGDFFDYHSPSQITVQSCTLEYEIDTKGFYQPVYKFALTLEGMDPWTVTVPARK